jgi:hypothetical protein
MCTKSEVLALVVILTGFWIVGPNSKVEIYGRFGGQYFPSFQGRKPKLWLIPARTRGLTPTKILLVFQLCFIMCGFLPLACTVVYL